ncbi:uracil-xanthine permease family protein [Terrisporobacter mayombei]|uniref:Uracil permease n=1 Tax=Terrisporobacter mayombei TaxID=1541 RepID=A0ABY9Q2G4_9FIRM|nr:uracil-xanthine permease family protein [Terrisporobacter mayombei]MCC3867329.1 uracil-xanthine permease family protein [Terrisporobacter mayombei]WMT81589.1 Uracil permease [Terrisporobacter mayombei]
MKKAILSIQHLLAMFGATVLVPLLTGFDPSVAIFCAGVGTLLFHKCTDFKVPVFLGSSFAFISVINQVAETFNGDLSYAQGGIIVAGLIYVVMSIIVRVVGPEKVKKFFPPQVTGAMIIVIGLNLIPTAIDMAMNNLLVALITLGVAVGINQFAKGSIRQFSVIIAIFVGIVVSKFVGITDFSAVSQASYFSIPNFSAPKFSLEAVIIIAPVVLAVFMEHVGDITTNGAVVGKNFLEDPGLHKTLLGDGIATLFAGFMGGPANTTYGENTALLAITKNYDPKLLRLTAVFAIVISCVGKFGAFLQSIPTAVMGGISIYLFSMITFIGIKTIRDSECYKENGNLSVMLIILVIGLTTCYVKHFTGVEIGIPIAGNSKLTGLSLAALVGIIVNILINYKDFKKEESSSIGELASTK